MQLPKLNSEISREISQPSWPELGEQFVADLELAKRWSCSVKTLRNHRSKRIGCPYVRLGRSIRYRLSDIVAFEAQGRVGQ